MKESAAIKAVSHKFVNRWKYLFGLEEWEIKFRYCKLDDDTWGECSVEPHHKYAHINVDIDKHKTADELLKTIRHELIHILHAHFNSYRLSVVKHLSPAVAETADEIFSIGAEDLVLKIENLLKRLEVDTKGYYE